MNKNNVFKQKVQELQKSLIKSHIEITKIENDVNFILTKPIEIKDFPPKNRILTTNQSNRPI